MRRKKQTLVFTIILLLLGLGIGYAAIATTLTINGTTDVDRNVWNVYWDNVQVTTGSVTGTQVTQAPIITDQTVVSFQVNLKAPGEFYEFTVDAKNTGTLDAMIDTITRPNNLPEYAKLSFTYNDDRELYTKQYLKANTTEKIKVRVEYRTDIDPSSLPETNTTVNLQVGATYVQADSTAQTRLLFVTSTDCMEDGSVIMFTQPSVYPYLIIENGEGTIKNATTIVKKGLFAEILSISSTDSYATKTQKLQSYCSAVSGIISSGSEYMTCNLHPGEITIRTSGNVLAHNIDDHTCSLEANGSYSCYGNTVCDF